MVSKANMFWVRNYKAEVKPVCNNVIKKGKHIEIYTNPRQLLVKTFALHVYHTNWNDTWLLKHEPPALRHRVVLHRNNVANAELLLPGRISNTPLNRNPFSVVLIANMIHVIHFRRSNFDVGRLNGTEKTPCQNKYHKSWPPLTNKSIDFPVPSHIWIRYFVNLVRAREQIRSYIDFLGG